MTTSVEGEDHWDGGNGLNDVQLNANDLFEENPPSEVKANDADEDFPSKAKHMEAVNEYPQGVFGTTPPTDGRHSKVQKRKSKKLSSAVVTTTPPGQRKRPYSVFAPGAVEREGDGERRRRSTDSDLVNTDDQPEKDNSSEAKPTGTKTSGARKQAYRDSQKERKKKTPRRHHEPTAATASRRVTFPEKPVLLPIHMGESSLPVDLHMHHSESASLVMSSQRFVCPPERKRFYRSLYQSLRRATGFAAIMRSGAAQKMEAFRPGNLRRGYSENLALTNPHGQFFDQIWLELRAYLFDQSVEDLNSQIFFRSHEVDLVLSRINDFKIIDYDDDGALYSGTSQASYASGCEVFSSAASSQLSEVSVASKPSVGIRSESTYLADGDVEDQGDGHESGPERQCSCDETKQFSVDLFLTKHQLRVHHKVEELLEQLEEAVSWFPNSSRMALAHPKCRNRNFRRRVDALTLWHKVTVGLADCLCRLSTWLGAQVTPPMVCMCALATESSTAASSVNFMIGDDEDKKDNAVMNSLSIQFSRMHTTSSSGDSTERPFKPSCGSQCKGPYHLFIDRALKTSGLKELMKGLRKFISPILNLAKHALNPPPLHSDSDTQYEETVPLLRHYLSNATKECAVDFDPERQPRTECWMDDFRSMNLPTFICMYIQLLRVPLDVMVECLGLQLALKPHQEPSPLSVKQLVFECRVTLEEAIEVHSFYNSMFEPASKYAGNKDIFAFEMALQEVLKIYFDYVQRWVLLFGPHVLEDEWNKAKKICSEIKGKESEAGRKFCVMVSHLLNSTADMLKQRLDECNQNLHCLSDELERRKSIGEVCHNFKFVFGQVKEQASKVLAFAKLLCKELEIAADFKSLVSMGTLMEDLQKTNHHQVVVSNNQICNMLFVPETVASNIEEIQELLGASLGIVHDPASSSHYSSRKPYLLLVATNKDGSMPPTWQGKTVSIDVAFETMIAVSEMEVHGVKMVVKHSQDLHDCLAGLLEALGSSLSTINKQTSSHENVAEQINDLKEAAWMLGKTLLSVASEVMEHLGMEDNQDKADLQTHYQSTLQGCFNLGFEYIREVFRLLGEDLAYEKLGREMLSYAQLWMRFVVDHCERGRGRCPQWAMAGLDFLYLACAPCVLAIISSVEFEALKKLFKRCQEHLSGSPYNYVRSVKNAKDFMDYQDHSEPPPLSKGRRRRGVLSRQEEERLNVSDSERVSQYSTQGSAHPDEVLLKHYQQPQVELVKLQEGYESPLRTESEEDSNYPSPGLESPVENCDQIGEKAIKTSNPSYHQNSSFTSVDTLDDKQSPSRIKAIRQMVMKKDKERNAKLQADRMIGKAVETKHSTLSDLSHIAQVHYRWTRGRKLGEGKFGMVYECFNWDTTECHAVKQLKIATKDFNTVKEIIDEISFYQKLNHPNIVKFYGVEIIKNDLYLFMEYCNEGTLWSMAQQGLSEPLMRVYTRDILKAVYEIHRHNIVHRDIKGANIFMASNTVKLGDFGLSVQLKYGDRMQSGVNQHGDAGTIPYMCPEVVRDRDVRPPMDIWSVGCVIVEMATRKIPWSEYDNPLTILYQIGSGVSPRVDPECLSAEGLDFLTHCFEVDPSKRWTAGQLQDHPFVKVYDEQ